MLYFILRGTRKLTRPAGKSSGAISFNVRPILFPVKINTVLSDLKDTADCWEQAAASIIIPESLTLVAVRKCIVRYNNAYSVPSYDRNKRDAENNEMRK